MPPTKPFHVEGIEAMKMKVMGVNMFPAMVKLFSLLPDQTRKNYATKQAAPSPDSIPYDQFDCLGTSPYTIKEVKSGKIWRVEYAMEDRGMIEEKSKKTSKSYGMDWGSEEVRKAILAGAASDGEEAVETAKADLERLLTWWNKTEWTMEERFSLPPFTVSSMVVKLNSGSLLLYAPTRIRDEVEFGAWLDSLGKVEYLVIASATHTLSLPAVLARYPEAKVIGSPQAEDKLNFVGALVRKKFDYVSTSKEDMEKVNGELEAEGVKLVPVEGDIATNAIMAVAHGVMLTCDLIYGRHDGGMFYLSGKEMAEGKEEHGGMRLFLYLMCNKPNSPNGFLAKYRFQMMDHTGLSNMMYETAAKDGSTCSIMAESLREVLNMEFESVEGVHCNSLSREEFRNSIDANWNWLDGSSLLDTHQN